jgi:L-asparaginase II
VAASGADVATGVDGCGVVAFSVPLRSAALMFARLAELEGGPRVIAAMCARPELVGGETAGDTHLMRTIPGAIAKRGAEAAFGIRLPDGTGVFAKSADGSGRAIRPALHRFLAGLGHDVPEWRSMPVTNSRDEVVGEIVAA